MYAITSSANAAELGDVAVCVNCVHDVVSDTLVGVLADKYVPYWSYQLMEAFAVRAVTAVLSWPENVYAVLAVIPIMVAGVKASMYGGTVDGACWSVIGMYTSERPVSECVNVNTVADVTLRTR